MEGSPGFQIGHRGINSGRSGLSGWLGADPISLSQVGGRKTVLGFNYSTVTPPLR